MSEAAIGIFDSGVGGLTVLEAIHRQLPGENLLYLGDTARVPYGNKSPQTIRRYAFECARALYVRGIKALVIACNTASAYALAELRAELPIPVFGVIEPVARRALASTRTRRIGVIGTRATIQSQAYLKVLKALDSRIEVFMTACPLFAPLVEEAWAKTAVARQVAQSYLEPFQGTQIDQLILGCTHYPILKADIEAVLPALGLSLELCDCAQATASDLAQTLAERAVLQEGCEGGNLRYLVTDDPKHFSQVAASFMQQAPEQVEALSLD